MKMFSKGSSKIVTHSSTRTHALLSRLFVEVQTATTNVATQCEQNVFRKAISSLSKPRHVPHSADEILLSLSVSQ